MPSVKQRVKDYEAMLGTRNRASASQAPSTAPPQAAPDPLTRGGLEDALPHEPLQTGPPTVVAPEQVEVESEEAPSTGLGPDTARINELTLLMQSPVHAPITSDDLVSLNGMLSTALALTATAPHLTPFSGPIAVAMGQIPRLIGASIELGLASRLGVSPHDQAQRQLRFHTEVIGAILGLTATPPELFVAPWAQLLLDRAHRQLDLQAKMMVATLPIHHQP
jgi:hypothetical protein